jgi:AraC family transcriptional activator of pyochelin receptor
MRTPSLINGTMQTLTVRPGLEVNWADFQPTEPIRQHVDSCHTRLRFYFYHTGCGHWQLRSPFEKAANTLVDQFHQRSTLFFLPEVAGELLFPQAQRQFHLSIAIAPEMISTYLGDGVDKVPQDLRAISEGCSTLGFHHSGNLTGAMTTAVHQLIHCPYSGPLKQLYIEAKALELVAHKLGQIASAEHAVPTVFKPGPDDLERIRKAQAILGRDLEHPPRLSELALQVGTNHNRLSMGFRQFCGTTVFGYLRQLRLEKAKVLIEQEGANVTEAALRVGYNSLPSFSKAFSRYFGLNPAQCRNRRTT